MFSLTRRANAALLFALAIVLSLPLIYLYSQSQPISLNLSEGSATIRFSADRNSVIFPGQCVTVSWNVEGIRAMYLNGMGRVGRGTQELCTFGVNPSLYIEFQDDTSRDYTLPVERLYKQPLVPALLAGVIFSLAGAAYLLWGVPGLLVVLTVVVFAPMLRIQLNLASDYEAHTMFATLGMENFANLPPHFLYHGVVIALHRLIPALNLEKAGFVLMVTAYIATGLITYALLRWATGTQPGERRLLLICGVVSFALMLIGPISFISDQYNPGDLTSLFKPNVYHNPTFILLKPFAIGLFYCLLRVLAQPEGTNWRIILVMATLTILATLAKPSYTTALAPAVGLLFAFSFIKPLPLNRNALLFGILIPAAIMLGWQYLFLYGPQSQSNVYGEPARVVFSPLQLFVVGWKIPRVWLPLEFVLSILFPLAVYLVYFRNAYRELGLNLAWLTFLGGAAIAYLFVELPNLGHGNMIWGAQISLFVLFVVSTAYLLRYNRLILRGEKAWDWRFALCIVIFAVHLVNQLLVLLN